MKRETVSNRFENDSIGVYVMADCMRDDDDVMTFYVCFFCFDAGVNLKSVCFTIMRHALDDLFQ